MWNPAPIKCKFLTGNVLNVVDVALYFQYVVEFKED